MNTNKKNSLRIIRAKRTLLGKILCRLAGEEKGAVMMEYVIVAVMIAAAVALGAYFFGATILDFFGIGQRAIAGEHVEAGNDVKDDRGEVKDRISKAKENANKFSTTSTKTPGGH